MRRVLDDEGREWDVVLGRASWGVFQALFVPAGSDPDEIRSAVLPDESRREAARRIHEMDSDELRSLLTGAGAGGTGRNPASGK